MDRYRVRVQSDNEVVSFLLGLFKEVQEAYVEQIERASCVNDSVSRL